MESLKEMRERASSELNIKIYTAFALGGLALAGIAEGVYYEADRNFALQGLAVGGALVAGSYGYNLAREIISRNNEDR